MIKPPQSWLSRRHRRHRLSWCPWKPPPPALPRPEKNEYIVNVKLLTHHHQSHLSVVLPFAAVGVSLVFTWAVWHLLFLETFCVMILLMESISYKWWICICFFLSFVFLIYISHVPMHVPISLNWPNHRLLRGPKSNTVNVCIITMTSLKWGQ